MAGIERKGCHKMHGLFFHTPESHYLPELTENIYLEYI